MTFPFQDAGSLVAEFGPEPIVVSGAVVSGGGAVATVKERVAGAAPVVMQMRAGSDGPHYALQPAEGLCVLLVKPSRQGLIGARRKGGPARRSLPAGAALRAPPAPPARAT